MRSNVLCVVFHVGWISRHSSPSPTLVADQTPGGIQRSDSGWDSEIRLRVGFRDQTPGGFRDQTPGGIQRSDSGWDSEIRLRVGFRDQTPGGIQRSDSGWDSEIRLRVGLIIQRLTVGKSVSHGSPLQDAHHIIESHKLLKSKS